MARGFDSPTTTRKLLSLSGAASTWPVGPRRLHNGLWRHCCDMGTQPVLHILQAPQKALSARQAANGRERLGVAGGITADAGDGFVDASGKLFHREQLVHGRDSPFTADQWSEPCPDESAGPNPCPQPFGHHVDRIRRGGPPSCISCSPELLPFEHSGLILTGGVAAWRLPQGILSYASPFRFRWDAAEQSV